VNIMEILPSLGPARGTSPYQWPCWGSRAQYIDWGGELNHIASCVFDLDTGLVYCLELYTGEACLRYLDPDFSEAFFAQCSAESVDPQWASEDQQFQDFTDPLVAFTVISTLTSETDRDPT